MRARVGSIRHPRAWRGGLSALLTAGLITGLSTLAATPAVAATPVISSISTGYDRTCAVTTSGGVKCWGTGYLGDGTSANSPVPVDVSGLTSGVSAISVGYGHTCAVTTAGGAKCWGSNYAGQLGDGTTTDRSVPVDVSGLTSGISAISASNGYTCAITTAGGAKCWGYNHDGQLGDGTTTDRSVPVDVSGLTSGVSAISAGQSNACAVTGGRGRKVLGLQQQRPTR
jgi:alpha-tubulin suppressor-like RCC1 family protein